MLAMSWHPVLFLNETTSGWSREENWALEGRQEQRARQKEEVKNSSFTIHSNRPDVRMMNGALYPSAMLPTLSKWGSGRMASTR